MESLGILPGGSVLDLKLLTPLVTKSKFGFMCSLYNGKAGSLSP